MGLNESQASQSSLQSIRIALIEASKMLRTFSLLMVIIGLASSCQEDDSDEFLKRNSIASLTSLPDTVSIQNDIELRVRIGTPNPCHLFDSYIASSQENKMGISFFTKYKQDEICITVPGRIDTLIRLKPLTIGPNILTLNPNTNFEIVDTIFVTN